VRRLIINADDLGLTAGVNRAIRQCCDDGVVTSTTLMANAPAFADAVRTAGELGRPSVGCHVVLVDGEPVLSRELVASLLRDNTARFHNSLTAFAHHAVRHRIAPDQIEAEATAQMRRLADAGIRISHFDTHKHTHLFPAVLQPLLRAARTCGVGVVRNPFAPLKPLAFAHLLRRPRLWKRYTEVKLLRGWGTNFRRTVAAAGMVTTDGTFGIVSTGALDLKLFRAIIGCIPEGTWEFCCHPGYNDAALAAVHTRLRASRDCERQVLTSATAREMLAENGIELITYWDLQ
jgi:predicted glycoside hydrolase/deacetylase ChbG (UPF0249 family)